MIDYGALNSPYLSSYGFLAVVLVMSYELAGKIVVNERRWRSLLDQSHLLISSVDRRGFVDYVNPFFEKVSGYSATEIKNQSFLRLLPENDRFCQEVSFHAALAGTLQPRKEAVLLTKSGVERVILWSSVLLDNGGGEIAGVLSVGVDITEQRQAETARDQALAELQNALHEVKALRGRLQDEVVYLQEEIKSNHNFEEIIGQSDALAYVLHKIEQVASLDTPVLIEGETGVGKELVARAIHNLSPRKNRPLVKINCAALPPNLIEAELFGYEKGAFTGAIKARRGRFELADGGTLFLDEIGELPRELQPKLLRVLQGGELERIGSETSVKVDVRIVAATNRHLREAIKQNQFREDLFYRLYVYPITVPPLRQRKEDIPLLAKAFIDKCAKTQGKRIETVQQSVMDQLLHYDWPGNVRELENVIERAVIVATGKALRLAESLVGDGTDGTWEAQNEVVPKSRQGYQGTLEEVERDYIVQILEHCYWRIEGERGAARLLGINPSTLRSRMRKLGIKRLSRSNMIN